MRFYCEVFARYALPAIRALLAIELSERGFTQEMIAEKLDLTQAAVSQYLRNVRGRGAIDISDERLLADIARLADKVVGGITKDEFAWECLRIFRNMEEYGLLKDFGDLYPSGFFSSLNMPDMPSKTEDTADASDSAK